MYYILIVTFIKSNVVLYLISNIISKNAIHYTLLLCYTITCISGVPNPRLQMCRLVQLRLGCVFIVNWVYLGLFTCCRCVSYFERNVYVLPWWPESIKKQKGNASPEMCQLSMLLAQHFKKVLQLEFVFIIIFTKYHSSCLGRIGLFCCIYPPHIKPVRGPKQVGPAALRYDGASLV